MTTRLTIHEQYQIAHQAFEKMRIDFEHWYQKEIWDFSKHNVVFTTETTSIRPKPGYNHFDVNLAWESWKASHIVGIQKTLDLVVDNHGSSHGQQAIDRYKKCISYLIASLKETYDR